VVAERRRSLRVGIPRSILHYEFSGATGRFLRSLGIHVVLSPPTDERIFRQGKRVVIDELCLPIKAFVGHVAELTGTGVDRILIPILVGHEDGSSFPCHQMTRLADTVRALDVCSAERLLSPVFRFDSGGVLTEDLCAFGRAMGASSGACARAAEAWQTGPEEARSSEGHGDGPTIGVVGRPYVVADDWINGGIVRKLEGLGCRVLVESPHERVGYAPDGTGLHFALAARTVTTAAAFDRAADVDGIVLLLPFNCGPDGDVVRRVSRSIRTPMLPLVLEEHRSDGGVVTRLEAFVDLMNHALANAEAVG